MSIKNIFGQITSFENLLNAEKEVGSGKKGDHREILLFREDLENNLLFLRDCMRSLSLPKAQFNVFYVYEPKVRKVIDIDYQNKVIQRALYDVVNPLVCKGFIYDTYSCVKEKGQIEAMKRLHRWEQQVSRMPGDGYYLKLDITKFFYRIPHDIMCKIVDNKIGDKRAASLIKHYINEQDMPFGLPLGADPQTIPLDEMLWDRGIPIGGGLSHMLANMILDGLDQYCKRSLRIHYYIRYMDDVIILSDSKSQRHDWKAEIVNYLSRLGLILNNKTAIRPISQGVEFVGFRIWPTHVTIRKSTSLRMKRRLKVVQKQYANYNISLKKASETVNSYKALMKHCNCHNLNKKIFGDFVLTHDKEKM